MLLTNELWTELIQVGLLGGQETCALCRERPAILLDVARAPILLCVAHAQAVAGQLQSDLAALDAQ
ncbi:MAG: hypothetical protein IT317_09985 [Anaerolineales bacterium]|nr:hypothetical protein [Anaerolineales bacterium]